MSESTRNTLPHWDLSRDYYAGIDDPKIGEDLAHNVSLARAFEEKYRGRIGTLSPSELAAAVKEYDEMQDASDKPQQYAALMHALHQDDKKVASLYAKVQMQNSECEKHLVFWELELIALGSKKLGEVCEQSQELRHYQPYLNKLTKHTNHVLSHDQEAILTAFDPVSAQKLLVPIYSELMATQRFALPEHLLDAEQVAACKEREDYLSSDTDGQGTCLLTEGEMTDLLAAPSEDVRKAAYEARRKIFGELASQPGANPAFIMNNIILAQMIRDNARKFAAPDSHRHLDNDVEAPLVNALRAATQESYALNQRYLRVKAKLLGKEVLDPWDEAAPTSTESNIKIPWEEAKRIVLETFADFSPKMYAIAQRAFDEGWIDAAPMPGKDSGAFSMPGTTSRSPLIMMNYRGKPCDVMTLAHEMGHAIHQYLAVEKQGNILSDTALTVAETASTFAETAVFNKLMETLKDNPRERLALLEGKVGDLMAVCARQIAYDDFERQIHAERKDGELTTERFAELWQNAQKKRLGDTIRDYPGSDHTWARVSHMFEVPFYVYAYAFGDLLANSLYNQYQQTNRKKEFVDKYEAMLASASTEHHSKAFKERFGDDFDLSNQKFWEGGLKIYGGYMDELEKAVDQVIGTPDARVAANDHHGHIDAERGAARSA